MALIDLGTPLSIEMMYRLASSSALILILFSSALADPSAADLQQLFKKGDYSAVVKGCTEALTPGGVTEPTDRFKIASLDGEAQLRLMQADAAVNAFNAAAKETEDAKQQSLVKATAILISRSKDFIYTSTTIKPATIKSPLEPQRSLPALPTVDANTATKTASTSKPAVLPRGQFDIIDSLHRSEAISALWTDERTDAEAAIKDKIAQKTLPAINEGLDRVHLAEPIAIAGGAADWVQTQKEKLANGARSAANATMKDISTQLIAIGKDQAKRHSGKSVRLMSPSQHAQVYQMTRVLDDISTGLTALALPAALNVDKDTFQPQLDQASRLQDRATTILATN